MISSGFNDCICSAPTLRPRKFTLDIFNPCKTQVELVWLYNAQNIGMVAKTNRIGSTERAAATSFSVNRARAASQNVFPASRLANSAVKKTLKKPLCLISRFVGTKT